MTIDQRPEVVHGLRGVVEDGQAPEGLDAYLRDCARKVDHQIMALLDAEIDDPWMHAAISYQFGWADTNLSPLPPDRWCPSGKKLRPALALLSYESAFTSAAGNRPSVCPAGDGPVAFAAAIELVHNFSLIHDDIEDGDHFRRGRPTLWRTCGQAQAINVGDTLHSLAYVCLGRVRGMESEHSTPLVRALAQAVVEMTVGQRRDMSYETEPHVNVEMYLAMIRGKTAALTACATYGGALLGLIGSRNPHPILERYAEFGRHFGLGYQVRDDILAVWGAELETGKPAGNDIRRRKKSFPVVVAFETASGETREQLHRLYASTEDLTQEEECRIRHALDECRAAAVAQSEVELHTEAALRALTEAASEGSPVSENPSLLRLAHLVRLLTVRTR